MIRGISLLILLLWCASCENAIEQPPAQLSINNYEVENAGENYVRSDFDLFINLDGEQLGVFEVPFASELVIEQERENLRFFPGIKVNGNNSQSAIHPFFDVDDSHTIGQNEDVTVVPRFKRNTDAAFGCSGAAGNSCLIAPHATASIANDAFGPYSVFSQTVEMDEIMVVQTSPFYLDINTGSVLLVELDYASQQDVLVGISREDDPSNGYVFGLLPRDELRRLYFNFYPEYTGTGFYKLSFASASEDGENKQLQFSLANINVLHF